mgnify:CR=1 FL=1
MARNAKLDRLLTLVKVLGESAEGLTLDEMAELIGANRRTAERLRDLILVHFDLEESVDDRHKRFRIPGALANSQREELEKFIEHCGLDASLLAAR